MSDRDLELLQAAGTQALYHHRKYLCIGGGRGFAHQLGTALCRLLQAPLIIGMVDKGIAHIAQLDRHILVHIVFGCASRDRRCEIRTQHKRVSLLVKELIQIL